MRSRIRFQFSGWACILCAISLLVLPLKWILAAIVAAVFHECCHIAAIKLCGAPVMVVRIGTGGAKIEIGPMGQGKELICALAGPVGGLLLLLLCRWIPRIAICAAVQSIYNLLPVYPLDGGRALRCAAQMLLPPDQADGFCSAVQKLSSAVIFAIGVWCSIRLRLGVLPLAAAAVILVKTQSIKIPCKQGAERVQ